MFFSLLGYCHNSSFRDSHKHSQMQGFEQWGERTDRHAAYMLSQVPWPLVGAQMLPDTSQCELHPIATDLGRWWAPCWLLLLCQLKVPTPTVICFDWCRKCFHSGQNVNVDANHSKRCKKSNTSLVIKAAHCFTQYKLNIYNLLPFSLWVKAKNVDIPQCVSH